MSFDEQPGGDIHADDPANYSAEGEEFPPVPTQLLWMFDGIDRKEATKMMHDYAASAIAWKPSAALRAAWERAQQAEDKARRLEDQLDACRPYLKEGETVADALIRMQKEITTLRNAAMRLWGDRSICDKEDAARYRWLLEHPTFAVHCFIYLPGHVSAEIDKELAEQEVTG